MYNFNRRRPGDRSEQKAIRTRPSSSADGDSASTSHLLTLPPEIRRRIFEFVLRTSIDTPFPPQARAVTVDVIRSWLSEPTNSLPAPSGVAGDRRFHQARNLYVDAPLICRQIYHEIRSLAFELHHVGFIAPYGSNISATAKFLGKLTPAQRGAIRGLEIHLVATPTEGWLLGNILKSVSGVEEKEGGGSRCEFTRGGQYYCFPRNNGLRSLKLHIKTNDLLFPRAESMSGLMHILTVGQQVFVARTSSVGASHQSWMDDGLVHLKALEHIDIEMNMSSGIANKILSSHRIAFEQRIRKIAPRLCDIQVRWIEQDVIGMGCEPHCWTDFLWLNHCIPSSVKA